MRERERKGVGDSTRLKTRGEKIGPATAAVGDYQGNSNKGPPSHTNLPQESCATYVFGSAKLAIGCGVGQGGHGQDQHDERCQGEAHGNWLLLVSC